MFKKVYIQALYNSYTRSNALSISVYFPTSKKSRGKNAFNYQCEFKITAGEKLLVT